MEELSKTSSTVLHKLVYAHSMVSKIICKSINTCNAMQCNARTEVLSTYSFTKTKIIQKHASYTRQPTIYVIFTKTKTSVSK
jgi:hypothetical protein